MSEIMIYEDGNVELPISFDQESFWLRQNEISKLFGKDRTAITRHINKILKDNEVDEKSNVQKMHIANQEFNEAIALLKITINQENLACDEAKGLLNVTDKLSFCKETKEEKLRKHILEQFNNHAINSIIEKLKSCDENH